MIDFKIKNIVFGVSIIVLIFLLSNSCIRYEPIEDDYVKMNDFELKRNAFETYFPDYFNKLNDDKLTDQEKSYLEYLFTYMPLSDFADYEYEFWKKHVQYAILATETFPWADSIPDNIFLHYVLPPRVNNENLDTARMVFYRELAERFTDKDYSAEEAVLEVNHWCNEKAIYRGTDERTISPLGIVRSGFGRCGEESTFLVTALRSVGIPARQVYTPRWAHTDDNHAWVEVWIDGEWNYLGACEPAPVLNTGWFDIPATRTMLIHTKQFGKDTLKSDNILSSNLNYSWVNALKKYAPTKQIKVKVISEGGIPIKGAQISYQIYNYAEMYPLFVDFTDNSGFSEFETGYGSLELFVSYNNNFISRIVSPEESGEIVIELGNENNKPAEFCEYIPPPAGQKTEPDPQLINQTNQRIKQNEWTRKASQKDFYNEYSAKHFAETFGYDERISPFLIQSRGNWPEIEGFLIEASSESLYENAVSLLGVISEKDLRDTKSEILMEHLLSSVGYQENINDSVLFCDYVLNPRVEFEMLKIYRLSIIEKIGEAKIKDLRENPNQIESYIENSVKTTISYKKEDRSLDEFKHYNVPLTPYAVNKFGLADKRSIKIFAVAFCRSIGIPARLDFASGFPQYYQNGKWNDMLFGESKDRIERARVIFVSKDSLRDYKYRINFSLALLKDNKYNTIDLGWEIPISDFSAGVEIPVGEYMLLTSLRLDDGRVLVKRKYFSIEKDRTLKLEIELPEKGDEQLNYKDFKHGDVLSNAGNNQKSSSLFVKNKYLVFIWLKPDSEPSNHILNDLENMYSELMESGIGIVYLSEKRYDADKEITNMFYIDSELKLLYQNTECKVSGSGANFPYIMMVNDKGKIVFNSSGYIINAGELFLQRSGF